MCGRVCSLFDCGPCAERCPVINGIHVTGSGSSGNLMAHDEQIEHFEDNTRSIVSRYS
jgi:hypothetical protein